MQIGNRFALSLPLADAWPLLSDLGRVAPLMPGVQVENADDEGLHAKMRVKVGPVTVSYKMLVVTESLDEQTHTAVLRATGREVRGQGTVSAKVTAKLNEADGGTVVELTTDLDVTGRVAQFGGGVMQEVADRLLQQFVKKLETDLTKEPEQPAAGDAAPQAGKDGQAAAGQGAQAAGQAPSGTAPRPAPAPEPEPVDLGAAAGAALAPKAAQGAAFLALLLAIIALLRTRRRAAQGA
jgi:carbon monoxide dehydrogenase subunit G